MLFQEAEQQSPLHINCIENYLHRHVVTTSHRSKNRCPDETSLQNLHRGPKMLFTVRALLAALLS